MSKAVDFNPDHMLESLDENAKILVQKSYPQDSDLMGKRIGIFPPSNFVLVSWDCCNRIP